MKQGEAESWLRQQLSTIYEERERAKIASMVLEKITGLQRLDRVTKRDELLPPQQLHQLTEITEKLQQHEPVQYLLEEAWFYDLPLFVDKNVLIPRTETEELVQWIIDDVKASRKDVFARGQAEADETTQLKILDVGTGSGCIALALKKNMPKAEVWGCDASDEALNVARRNGSHLDIRVDFVGLNFLDTAQRRQLPTVDMIVSNPPYVPQRDKQTMRANVINFEPHIALFVPDDNALIFYEALAEFGKDRLYNGGSIYAEIHEDLGGVVIDLFKKCGYKKIELRKDMQGKDRMVKTSL